ncbi:PREDICTED: uncharacterized protein LOC106810154 isoform X2 [Priapulus caudatus]|uniref:Uncharacterized protein LOC106810154 isoform X2 n=1 Tax=Priapulus caudatus TaxID=37621 RepID=A0ABM1E9Q1_PRICU|nr:PREDICTED: uncharacterized protein LOC106810154 isoform X2 [Priapulus caudatus]
MEIGAEISHKIRHAIKAKLVDLGAYVDDELPDYIMVMVANKKTQQQMTDDLALFLGNNAAKFTTWLHEVLYKLQSVTVETLKSEKKKDKLRPEGARDARDHEPRSSTHVEHVSSKRKAEQSERVDSSKTISKKHKRADWDESANASSSKLTESSVSQTAHQTKSPDAHPSTCDQQENADADDSESLDSRPGLPNEIGEGSQSREQAASSKEDSEEEQEKGDATSENENSAEEVEVEPEKEEMLLDVKPGEGEQIDSDSEAEQDYQPIKKKIVHGCVISTKQKVLQKVVPSKTSSGVHKPGASTAPSVGATVERTERVVEVTRSDSRREMETRRNLSSTRGDLRRPASAVQHSETAIGKSAEGAVPKKRQVPGSVIAGVIKREEVVEEAYNPYKPSVGAVASTVKVTPRRFLPKSLQANKSLLLKAMTDAESSIAKAVKLPGHTTMAVDQKHSSVHDRLGGAATKRQHPAQRAGKSAALSERMVSKQQQQLPAQKRRDDRQKSGVKKTLARPTVLQRLGLPMEKSSSTQTARGFERRASNHVAEVITIKQEVEEPEVFILSEDDDAEQESQGDARKAGEDEEEAVETEEAGREKMKPLLERSPSSGPSEESKDVTSGDELVNEEDIQDVSVGEELDRRLIQIDKDEVNVKKERRGDGDGFSLESTEEGEIPHRIVEAKGDVGVCVVVPTNSNPPKLVRNQLTLEKKLEVIYMCEQHGMSTRMIAETLSSQGYRCGRTQIQNILKNRQHWIEELQRNAPLNRKRKVRRTGNAELNSLMYEWVRETTAQMLPMSGSLLQEKARQVAVQLGLDDFKASNGWLESFRRRHSIVFGKVSEERASVEAAPSYDCAAMFAELCAGYAPRDIYNVAETAIFFKATTDSVRHLQGAGCSAGKWSKARVTVVLCANAVGDKETAMVVGKAEKPRCFGRLDRTDLPVDYCANKMAWMTSELFEVYTRRLDEKMRGEGRHVLMLLDNAPCHPDLQLTNIKLLFVPQSSRSVIQPMDRGIVRALKRRFRERQVAGVLRRAESEAGSTAAAELMKATDILQTICLVSKSWRDTDAERIRRCFLQCGIGHGSDHGEVDEEEGSGRNDMLEAACENALGVSLTDLVQVDSWFATTDNAQAWTVEGMPLRAVESGGGSGDGSDEEEEDDTVPQEPEINSLHELHECVDKIKAFAVHRGYGAILNKCIDLEETVEEVVQSEGQASQATMFDLF